MILQLTGTLGFVVWLLVATILLGLFIYLSTRWIVSKTKASDKLLMIFICAVIAVLLIPIIGTVFDALFGAVGDLITQLTGGPNYLLNLTPIIQFLVFLLMIKFFISEDWGDATWISLISLLLLFLLYTCFPILYTFLNFTI